MSVTNPNAVSDSSDAEPLSSLVETVEELEERVETVEEENEELRERAERAEQERDELRERLTEEETRNGRTRGLVANLINTVRDYDLDEGEGVSAEDDDLPEEMANVADELHDTVEFCRENNELLKIRERDYDQENGRTRSKVRKQLDVIHFAKKHAKANEKAIWRMDYRQVAAEYGCHKNDAYRVMDDMSEIPGIEVKNSRNLSWDVQGIGGKFLEVQLKHPEIHGWIRARE